MHWARRSSKSLITNNQLCILEGTIYAFRALQSYIVGSVAASTSMEFNRLVTKNLTSKFYILVFGEVFECREANGFYRKIKIPAFFHLDVPECRNEQAVQTFLLPSGDL